MRRIHLIVGLLGVLVFLLTGQVMGHHHPGMAELSAEVRMMYVSRHIYLLGAALVNVALGLYFETAAQGWRHVVQTLGSLLIVASPILLAAAFFSEPSLGLAGRGAKSYCGLLGIFFGVMLHLVSSVASARSRHAG